jgi:hypothetical protein
VRRNTSKIAVALLVAVAVVGSACDKDKEFAKLNARVAGYLDIGIALVDRQTASGQMSPATGIKVIETLNLVNTINGQLIAESRLYLAPDGKSLTFDANGKAKVLQIVESGQRTLTNLLNSPEFASIPDGQKRAWLDLINNLTLTFATLHDVVQTAKEVKQ